MVSPVTKKNIMFNQGMDMSLSLNLGAWTFKSLHSSLLDYLFFDFFYDRTMPNIRLVVLGET